jgi:protocatechuate 4,5-dioxygenase beta chain
VLVIYTDDHFNTFFLDNFPTFAIGIAEDLRPQRPDAVPSYQVAVQSLSGNAPAGKGVSDGFDLVGAGFDVDHATMVPLHFLTPDMAIPIVPIFVKTGAAVAELATLLCSARRGGGDRELARQSRVVIGSGSFAQIGGPKIPPGERAGTPDPEWGKRVGYLERARVGDLVAEPPPRGAPAPATSPARSSTGSPARRGRRAQADLHCAAGSWATPMRLAAGLVHDTHAVNSRRDAAPPSARRPKRDRRRRSRRRRHRRRTQGAARRRCRPALPRSASVPLAYPLRWQLFGVSRRRSSASAWALAGQEAGGVFRLICARSPPHSGGG